MKPDPGSVALAVLRILAHGARSAADVRAALSQYPDARTADAIERLKADGLVQVKWKRLELTPAGWRAAPSAAPNLAHLHGTYVPPRVVRRAGTDIHQRLPSRVGGQLIYRSQA